MKKINFCNVKKLFKGTWIISLLYAIFLVFGNYAMQEKHIDFSNLKLYFFIAMIFLPINLICMILFNLLDNLQEKQKDRNYDKIFKSKRAFLVIFAIIFILWIPQFLSTFPGCFNYDAIEILNQSIEGKYISQYPPFYSIILVGFIKFSFYLTNGYVLGIATYTILQMIISAVIFTYSIYILDKYNISKYIKIFDIIYYSIFPAVYLYVLSFTKDSLFTCFFYLSFLLYLELVNERDMFFKNKRWILLIISNIFAILLRRNTIYVFIIFSVILFFIILPKNKFKVKIVLIFALPIIVSSIINNYLNKILNIEVENNINAMLSVPVQQIAYVYNNNSDSINEYQKSKILEIADENILINYYPETSDSILYYIETNKIVENGKEYFKIWLDIGKKNISNYLNAIIRLDYGYFYPNAIQKIYIKNDVYENREFKPNWFMINISKNDYMENLKIFNSAVADGTIQKIPIVKYVCSIGAFLWIYIFVIAYLIYKKRKKFLYVTNFITLLLLTYLLGSLVMVRYFLILFFAFPIVISMIFCNENEKLINY